MLLNFSGGSQTKRDNNKCLRWSCGALRNKPPLLGLEDGKTDTFLCLAINLNMNKVPRHYTLQFQKALAKLFPVDSAI